MDTPDAREAAMAMVTALCYDENQGQPLADLINATAGQDALNHDSLLELFSWAGELQAWLALIAARLAREGAALAGRPVGDVLDALAVAIYRED